MNLIEVIKKRASVRTYEQNTNIDFNLLEAKIAMVNSKIGPFGNKINIQLVQSNVDSKDIKLGTYGMIKGASNYLVVTCFDDLNSMLDLGYLFEEVVLYATHLGLGTVWMAGTFSKKHFQEAVGLEADMLMPIVSPIGKEATKKSFVNKYVAKSKAHVRKDFGTLFIDNTGKPLVLDESPYMQALEMLRLAPSAMNKQPWRVIKDGDTFHFYNNGKNDTTNIDLGIALYHFDASLKYLNVEGTFTIETNSLKPGYVATWKLNK